ncbi:MAG: DUF4874 domain-containing protein [Ruminococcaceae bacterium]|nr:DUF4874 domain-containing protein [Oscillospiraceae bacterium]
MKKIRLIAFVLTAVMLFSSLCGCVTQNAHVTLKFDAITSEQDMQLRYNPDRGWRGEAYVNVGNKSNDGQTVQNDPAANIRRFAQRYAEYPSTICQVYFYLTAFKNDSVLPDYAFENMQKCFDTAKELGMKLTVRFAYQGSMDGTGEAEDDIMLAHMKQLKPLLEKNVDRIHVVEAGFLGVWGEWHSYKLEHDQKKLLKGIIEMTPKQLYVQVRYPGIKNLINKKDENYSRLGFHDDSFFGYRNCSAAATLNPGEDDWKQVVEESPFVPVGGECFWGYENSDEIDAFDSIIQYSAFRQNSFSIFHSFIEDAFGYGDYGNSNYYPMKDWLTMEISEEWLKKNNITYAPGWFLNAKGEKVTRYAFDFISDYLGYKLELKEADLSGELNTGGKLDVDLKLVNYGFSAAFHMQSSLVILDKKGNIVSEVKAGDPESWNSRNPKDYEDGKLLTHTVKGTIDLPDDSGEYRLAFRLCNSEGTGARVGNNLRYSNGCTVIYEFEI